ncbi:MAG: HIT family protein [Chloroflexota bacterium]
MEKLWSPWRSQYIDELNEENGSEPCFICSAIKRGEPSSKAMSLCVSDTYIALLNKYPYNAGHLLIAPARHVGEFTELTPAELTDINLALQQAIAALKAEMNPQGFNIGLNLGSVAGAGLPGHVHWHIVPRWNGDTNFMPLVSETKVVSQSMEEIYEKLLARFK